MNTPAGSSGEIGSYVQLQHQIHDALREQHPEWIEQNGIALPASRMSRASQN